MASKNPASKDPFNFDSSVYVAPIPCVSCGNNMHCVRRSPMATGVEQQLFLCAACGGSIERSVGHQQSDADIQREAERRAGIAPDIA